MRLLTRMALHAVLLTAFSYSVGAEEQDETAPQPSGLEVGIQISDSYRLLHQHLQRIAISGNRQEARIELQGPFPMTVGPLARETQELVVASPQLGGGSYLALARKGTVRGGAIFADRHGTVQRVAVDTSLAKTLIEATADTSGASDSSESQQPSRSISSSEVESSQAVLGAIKAASGVPRLHAESVIVMEKAD